MGPAGQLIAVADAGPLIHLHEIGELRLLRVFDLLHVTEDVWAEATSVGRVPDSMLTAATTFSRQPVPANERERFAAVHRFQHLQSGEVSALQLCHTEQVSILLTDDFAVRDAARAIGVLPVGSIGIVVRAFRHKIIELTHAERALMSLFEKSSLFVTRTIIDLAIEQLRPPP